MMPTIAIVGASIQRHKYGNRAVRAYAQRGWVVYPIHPIAEIIEGHQAYASIRDVPVSKLDRASFYLPPHVGLQVLDELTTKSIGEIWLNPGAANPQLIARGKQLGLNIVAGCSILDIGVDPGTL